ncbi:MAG: HDOD domain-containing protein [Gallionellaceae bacterium]|nr:HDOD domain-containing protein [Gallionellaceae bacterium]
MTPYKNLNQAVGQLESLPAIPHIAQKILSLKIATEEGEKALFKLIEEDPIILSKVIGLANSPVYGSGRRILTLHDAAAVLGTKRVKMSALSLSMMTSLNRRPPGRLDVEKLWQHSLSIAIIMDMLARYMPQALRPGDEEVYLAGLLHDIGFLVLDFIAPQVSDEFHARLLAEPECSMEEMEAKILEMTHSELGAQLVSHWDLPEPIVAVVRSHHLDSETECESVRVLNAMLKLAGKLLANADIFETADKKVTAEDWQRLSINPLKADDILAKVAAHINAIEPQNA